jgi:hypothetical protein
MLRRELLLVAERTLATLKELAAVDTVAVRIATVACNDWIVNGLEAVNFVVFLGIVLDLAFALVLGALVLCFLLSSILSVELVRLGRFLLSSVLSVEVVRLGNFFLSSVLSAEVVRLVRFLLSVFLSVEMVRLGLTVLDNARLGATVLKLMRLGVTVLAREGDEEDGQISFE